ncbi:hypothetical protein EVAR_40562_1 [Eumeta japonica]|uniref:DUF659 domain-containing protein n=1 Tax=Eumeta variegata TaxID=151549 RepID=A0A4C1VXP9_EUMVA|nr:hypothetical protein EVAR_40562_1 [Eumeta japonica]
MTKADGSSCLKFPNFSPARVPKMPSDESTGRKQILTCTLRVAAGYMTSEPYLTARYPLTHRAVSDHIRFVLEELVSTWDIASIIHVIMRDNGPNMVKAINESPFIEESHFTFWNCYEELQPTNSVISEDPISPIAVELDSYAAQRLLPRDQSHFDWWAKHKSKYAHLSN